MSPSQKQFALFIATLALALALFYAPFLINASSFYTGDISFFFEPLCGYIGRSFQCGRLPLWNPLSYCGMPQIAIPSPGLFYPGTALFAATNFSQALALTMLIHQLLAAAGAYLLIAVLGWGVAAAALGGVAYGCCGYMFALNTNYTLVATAAWLPWLLSALLLIGPKLNRTNGGAISLAAVSLALMIMAGRPEIFIPGGMLAAGLVLVIAIRDGRADAKSAVSSLAWRALSMVLGLMLAAPSIVPVLEWTALSPRAHGLDAHEVMRWSAGWYHLLCLALPQPLADMSPTNARYLSLLGDLQGFVPYVTSTYLGPVVLTLALWGLFDRGWNQRWFILALFVISLAITMGSNTPLLPALLSAFPVCSVLRYPSKILIIPIAVLCLIAARGLHFLLEKQSATGSGACQITALCLWGVAFTVSMFLLVHGAPSDALSAAIMGSSERAAREASMIMAGQMAVTAAMGLALAFLFNAYTGGKVPQRILLPAMALLLIWSLFAAAVSGRHETEPSFFSEKGALAAKLKHLQEQDGKDGKEYRTLATYTLLRPCPDRTKLKEALGDDAAFHQYNRFLLHPNTHLDSGTSSAFGYETAETGDYQQAFLRAMRHFHKSRAPRAGNQPPTAGELDDRGLANFCLLTATKYVLTPIDTKTTNGRYILPAPDNRYFTGVFEDEYLNVRIHAFRDCLPRAYLSDSCAAVGDDLIERLLENQTERLDLQQQSFVSQSDAEAISALMPPQAVLETGTPHSLALIKDEGERLQLQADTARTRLLVLTDHYYPGWQATIDGIPSRIFRINIFNRGVVVPAGKHLIQFEYRPDSLKVGLAFFLTALLLMLALNIVRSLPSMPSVLSRTSDSA